MPDDPVSIPSDSAVQKTIRLPQTMVDEINELLGTEEYAELDLTRFIRLSLRREIARSRLAKNPALVAFPGSGPAS